MCASCRVPCPTPNPQFRELLLLVLIDVIPSTIMAAVSASFFGVGVSAAFGILLAQRSPASVYFVVPMFAACVAGLAGVLFVQVRKVG